MNKSLINAFVRGMEKRAQYYDYREESRPGYGNTTNKYKNEYDYRTPMPLDEKPTIGDGKYIRKQPVAQNFLVHESLGDINRRIAERPKLDEFKRREERQRNFNTRGSLAAINSRIQQNEMINQQKRQAALENAKKNIPDINSRLFQNKVINQNNRGAGLKTPQRALDLAIPAAAVPNNPVSVPPTSSPYDSAWAERGLQSFLKSQQRGNVGGWMQRNQSKLNKLKSAPGGQAVYDKIISYQKSNPTTRQMNLSQSIYDAPGETLPQSKWKGSPYAPEALGKSFAGQKYITVAPGHYGNNTGKSIQYQNQYA